MKCNNNNDSFYSTSNTIIICLKFFTIKTLNPQAFNLVENLRESFKFVFS